MTDTITTEEERRITAAAGELRDACAELGRALAQLHLDRGPRGYITDPTGRQELDMVMGWLSTAYEAVDGVASDLEDTKGGNR